MGAPECGGRDMPRPPVHLRLARYLAWVARPYEPLADSRCSMDTPSKLGNPGKRTARPRPVLCSRFRRQIQTPRGAWIWHLGTPAGAGEPFYLGAASRPFKPIT